MPGGHVDRGPAARAAGLSFFRTLEFAFTSYLPFSQSWDMGVESTANSFIISPEGLGRTEPPWNADWEEKLITYIDDEGYDLVAQMESVPNLDARATSIASELADILQGKTSVSSPYETVEPAELEDRIVIDWLLNPDNLPQDASGVDAWRHPGYDGVREIMDKVVSYDYRSKESLDLMANTAQGQRMTEFALHRLAANFGGGDTGDFMDGVVGIEMTKMVGQKMLQQIYARTATTTSAPSRFQAAAEEMASGIMEEYNRVIGKTDATILQALESMGTIEKEAGIENMAYITKQIVDRIAEVTHRVGSEAARYIYQVPLVDRDAPVWDEKKKKWKLGGTTPGRNVWLMGFARFEPVITPASSTGHPSQYKLQTINVKTRVADLMRGAGAGTGSAWITEDELKQQMDAATGVAYGTFAQWLMVDAATNMFEDNTQLSIMNDMLMRTHAIWADFTGQRGELLGSHMWSNIGDISKGMIQGDVRAVDILSTTEITESIRKQIENFYDPDENTGLTDELAKLYERAAHNSNQATNAWKSTFNIRSNLTATADVWRLGGGLYNADAKGGQGVGLPFFLTSGRNPAALKRFKIRRKAEDYIEKRHRPAVKEAGNQFNPAWLDAPTGYYGTDAVLLSGVPGGNVLRVGAGRDLKAESAWTKRMSKTGDVIGPGKTGYASTMVANVGGAITPVRVGSGTEANIAEAIRMGTFGDFEGKAQQRLMTEWADEGQSTGTYHHSHNQPRTAHGKFMSGRG